MFSLAAHDGLTAVTSPPKITEAVGITVSNDGKGNCVFLQKVSK
jgi:hypothetical protein